VVRNFLFNPINNYCPGLGRPTTWSGDCAGEGTPAR
jgi:hypothetical protein